MKSSGSFGFRDSKHPGEQHMLALRQAARTEAETEQVKIIAESLGERLRAETDEVLSRAELNKACSRKRCFQKLDSPSWKGRPWKTKSYGTRWMSWKRTAEARVRSIILDAEAKRITVDSLGERLRAEIDEILSRAGLNEARRNEILQKLEPEIQNIKANTQVALQQAARVEAETEQVKAETRRTEELINILKLQGIELKDRMERARVEWVASLVKEAPTMERSTITELLMGGDGGIRDQARAEQIAEALSQGAQRKLRMENLAITKEEVDLVDRLTKVFGSDSPQVLTALREYAKSAFPNADEKFIDAFVEKAKFIGILQTQGMLGALFEQFAQRIPENAQQYSQAAREAYDKVLGSCISGGSDAKTCTNRANAFVNALKAEWEYRRVLRDAKLRGEVGDAKHKEALANYYSVMAKVKPEELKIDWAKVDQGWEALKLDAERVKQGWKKLELEERELLLKAQAAGASQADIDTIKKLADIYNDLVKDFNKTIAAELHKRGYSTCADAIGKSGAPLLNFESAVLSPDCAKRVREIFDDPNWNPVKGQFAMIIGLNDTLFSISSWQGRRWRFWRNTGRGRAARRWSDRGGWRTWRAGASE